MEPAGKSPSTEIAVSIADWQINALKNTSVPGPEQWVSPESLALAQLVTWLDYDHVLHFTEVEMVALARIFYALEGGGYIKINE